MQFPTSKGGSTKNEKCVLRKMVGGQHGVVERGIDFKGN